MKIAVVSHDSFWPIKGGGGIRVYWVVKSLVEKGHDVTVIAPFNELEGLKEEFPTIHIKNLGKYSRFNRFKEIQYTKLAVKIFLRLLFSRFDIIYAHNIVAAYPSYKISKIKKIPLLFDMDDILTGLSKNKFVRKVGQKIEFLIAKKCSCLITMSQSLKQEILNSGINREISVVMHGVNLSLFYPRDMQKKNKIIYMGGIEPHDGTNLLPEAAIQIIKEFPDIQFEVIGDGKSLASLINNVEKRGILDHFSFMTWLKQEELPNLLAESKIGVITHLRSPATEICLVLKGLEYMAMGLPVVAPDLKGMREEFGNNERGLLFEPGNPRDLTNKLLILLKDPELGKTMGAKGIEFVKQNCEWRENAGKIIKISEDCFDKYKKR